MSIHCQLDFDDVLALQRHVVKHSYTHYIKKTYFKWISAVLLFLTIWFIFQVTLTSAMAGAVITAVYVFMFPALYVEIVMARAKSQMQNQDLSHIIGQCDMTLTEEGIDREKDGTITHFNWDQFIKLGEDDQHFFLYKSDLQGLILPKKPADKNQDDIAAYQAQIKGHVNPTGSTKSSAITETSGKDNSEPAKDD
ncbi:hypothetical protein GCM10028778_13000 [Barrientosiimonas marina]